MVVVDVVVVLVFVVVTVVILVVVVFVIVDVVVVVVVVVVVEVFDVDDVFVEVCKVGQTQSVVLVVVVVEVVVVVVVVGTNFTEKGHCKLCATVSTHVPSRLERWILSVQQSAQKSVPMSASKAMPWGERIPAALVTMSIVVPLFKSCFLTDLDPESVK